MKKIFKLSLFVCFLSIGSIFNASAQFTYDIVNNSDCDYLVKIMYYDIQSGNACTPVGYTQPITVPANSTVADVIPNYNPNYPMRCKVKQIATGCTARMSYCTSDPFFGTIGYETCSGPCGDIFVFFNVNGIVINN